MLCSKAEVCFALFFPTNDARDGGMRGCVAAVMLGEGS
jgi:hypothetical protein